MQVSSAMRHLLAPALTALLALAALPGCSAFGPNVAGIVFETTVAEYFPGDVVTARLENKSDSSVGYNLCFTSIEAKADAWVPVVRPGSETRFCEAIQVILEPHRVDETRVVLAAALPPGQYRLVTEIEMENNRRVMVMAPFEVR